MKTMKSRILASFLGALICSMAGSARAAERETFEPGTGKYILVLKDPRTDQDDPVTGKKKAKEPDVLKHGGKVLHKKESTRIITLPTKAAGALRKEENVAYLQRVWLGESSKEWADEHDASSIKAESESLLETHDEDLTWTTGQYLYDGTGNIKQIGDDTYHYDTMGRLTRAVVKGIIATYQYDSFGNLVGSIVNGIARSTPVDASSNRLQGETYDVAGNLATRAGTPRYNYDSFSMLDQLTKPYSNVQRYIYGPDDERIATMTVGGVSRWKFRDFSGKVLREFKAPGPSEPWVWIEDHVHAEGRVIAGDRESYYGGRRHFHTDHLGSVRMITDQKRMRIGVHDFYPFGIEQTDATQEHNRFTPDTSWSDADARSDPMKFTGHERDWHGWLNVDNDDYLDYMHARYYDPNLGRFLSVDPTWESADLGKPQSWNRYAYVMNNPVKLTDPDGRTAAVAWWLLRTFGPPAARYVARETVVAGAQATRLAAAEYAAQRLSGFEYARPVVIPTQLTSSDPYAIDDSRITRVPDDQIAAAPDVRGNAPTGVDGHPIEIHHDGQQPDSPLVEMTRTDHRGKGNFGRNHQNTGQSPSQIDRKSWVKAVKDYWKREWDRGRFNDVEPSRRASGR